MLRGLRERSPVRRDDGRAAKLGLDRDVAKRFGGLRGDEDGFCLPHLLGPLLGTDAADVFDIAFVDHAILGFEPTGPVGFLPC